MAIEPTYILYGVIFLTVILLVEGAYYFFIDSTLTKRRANRRLTMLGAGMEGREVLELLRRRSSRYGQSVSPLRHPVAYLENLLRSEEHTSELQSLMRISYAVFCLKKQTLY